METNERKLQKGIATRKGEAKAEKALMVIGSRGGDHWSCGLTCCGDGGGFGSWAD